MLNLLISLRVLLLGLVSPSCKRLSALNWLAKAGVQNIGLHAQVSADPSSTGKGFSLVEDCVSGNNRDCGASLGVRMLERGRPAEWVRSTISTVWEPGSRRRRDGTCEERTEKQRIRPGPPGNDRFRDDLGVAFAEGVQIVFGTSGRSGFCPAYDALAEYEAGRPHPSRPRTPRTVRGAHGRRVRARHGGTLGYALLPAVPGRQT